MAVGDIAAASGYPVVPSTKKLNLGYEDINRLADTIAQRETGLDTRLDTLEAQSPWITYIPTLTDWSLGTGGTRFAEYRVSGKQVTVRFRARTKPGASVNDPKISLPIPMETPVAPDVPYEYLGGGTMWDSNNGNIFPLAAMRSVYSLTNVTFYGWSAANSGYMNISSAALQPFGFTSDTGISATFTYKIA